MTELLTAAQMRAVEREAIESGEVTGLELMERAGRGVVEAVFEEWPELAQAPHKAVVLCGPGNNGGDGFVVARLLREWGWEVEVFLYGDAEKLPPDAKVNYERWREMGEVETSQKMFVRRIWQFGDEDRPDLWVDALFGTGLTRPLGENVGMLLQEILMSFSEAVDRAPGKIVSVDLPSGLDSDTGKSRFKRLPLEKGIVFDAKMGARQGYITRRDGKPLPCSLTVTFHRAKLGHFLESGPEYCGKVVVKSIGLE